MAASIRNVSQRLVVSYHSNNLIRSVPCLSSKLIYPQQQQLRWGTGKHYNPKWHRYRWAKYVEVEGGLPDFVKQKKDQNIDPSEMRRESKKKGYTRGSNFEEKKVLMLCSGSAAEEFVPPEGDGVASLLSAERTRASAKYLKMKSKTTVDVRKIKKYDEAFDMKTFPALGQEVYFEALDKLNNIKENEDRLHDLITEKAYSEIVDKLQKKTVRWKFLGSLQPPRVVHVRVVDVNKDMIYGQVTVRFHTQQTLGIYDRFGRLMYGSEHQVKDCLEFIVFEKLLVEEYSNWRVHHKIQPAWLPPSGEIIRSLRKPKFEEIIDDDDDKSKSEEGEKKVIETNSDGPKLATA